RAKVTGALQARSRSRHPLIVESKIVLPGTPVLQQLTSARDRVAVIAERAGEALREVRRRRVTPVPPLGLIETGGVHPVHAALVEVMQGQLPVGDTDDRDPVRNLGVVVVRAPDNESSTIQPLEGARSTDRVAREHRVRSLGLPPTDEAIPSLKLRFLSHGASSRCA